MPWNPTTILRADQPYNTATETIRVTTDAGPGFLKAMGNRGGPHLLAAELTGTQLAHWLGLPIFDFALVNLTEDDDILFYGGARAQPGPAFVTREHSGTPWGGDARSLQAVVNPADLARLVLFDTWTRNCDRFPPAESTRRPNYNNVYLSAQDLADGELRLIAMDHTHCFDWGRDLTERLAHIELVQDERIYGLFPPFRHYLDAHRNTVEIDLARLAGISRDDVASMVSRIPREWQVGQPGREALIDLIWRRGEFVAENFVQWVYPPNQ